ncbi:MAG TPA: hypothetical protein DCR93_21405 [Cytophagales bacterium]|nr:hypothetical protein [Cytophagales bacterium]
MNFLRSFFRFLKRFFLVLAVLILAVVIVYFVAPSYVKDTVVSWLYPTVTIKEEHLNQVSVEVPRVYELMYIACTLTETFQADDNLIGSRTPHYLAEVKAHFGPLEDHPLVKTLEARLKDNAYSQLQPAIRLFSMNYALQSDNTLLPDEVFHVNPLLLKLFKSQIFNFPDHQEIIEDFARASGFYQFYDRHLTDYQRLYTQYNRLCELQTMWKWIEQRCPARYHSYRVIFSPLTGGFHNTLPGLKDPETDYMQTWMFVSPPPTKPLDSLSAEELEVLRSKVEREVFTEIDHNYVNPISDSYQDAIAQAMPDFREWNGKESSYGSSQATFNEYMTWGVFSLYATETYSADQVDTILAIQEDFMVNSRKFFRFQEFNQELIRQYEIHKQTSDQVALEALYPGMLQWMEEQT